jgi:hypothetical protein
MPAAIISSWVIEDCSIMIPTPKREVFCASAGPLVFRIFHG